MYMGSGEDLQIDKSRRGGMECVIIMRSARLPRFFLAGMLAASPIAFAGNEDHREANLRLQAEADFVVHYHIDERKLDVGIGKENENGDREGKLFTLEELKEFFDEQKHKDLLFVRVEGNCSRTTETENRNACGLILSTGDTSGWNSNIPMVEACPEISPSAGK